MGQTLCIPITSIRLFTYVKNKEFELKDCEHTVSGMLLYAQTDENVIPNNTYQMSGNQISVRALNLNQDFSGISEDLDSIIKKAFLLSLGRVNSLPNISFKQVLSYCHF